MMYLDKKTRRVLLHNGISILPVDDYVKRMLREGDIPPPHIRIEAGVDSELMMRMHQVDVGYDIDTPTQPPIITHTNSIIELDVEKYPRISLMLDLYGDIFLDRLEDEIEFFERENSELIYKLMILIDKFKTDGVIWGVGRGSACASVLLYIIEVHDLDPIKHKIPFSELSKEVIDEH